MIQRVTVFKRIPTALASESNTGWFVVVGDCPRCDKNRMIFGVDDIEVITNRLFSGGIPCLVCESGITDALRELREDRT